MSQIFVRRWQVLFLLSSVADPECFDAAPYPDPTFQADADPDLDPDPNPAPDPDPNPFTRVRNFSFKSSLIVSKVFQNLSCVISQQECERMGEG